MSAFFHRSHYTEKVIICKNHASGFLAHLGSGDPHGHTDIGCLQGRGIIYSVTSHGYNLPPPL